MQLLEMVDTLIDLVIPDDPGDVLGVAKDLIILRNATEHQLAVHSAAIDASGLAREAGSTTAKLLQANGAPPGADIDGYASAPDMPALIARPDTRATGSYPQNMSIRWSKASPISVNDPMLHPPPRTATNLSGNC